jgi:hypothetical protein
MSLIVAGRFTTFPAAEAAASQLFANGFVEEDVTLFFVNPRGQHARYPIGGDVRVDVEAEKASVGATKGGAIGAVAGAILGVGLFRVMSAPGLVLIIAAGVGAYVGSLIGAMSHMRGGGRVPRESVHRESRDSGVLVAVHVSLQTQAKAAQLLREQGALEIERATGRWQQGRWSDFDPTRTLEPIDNNIGEAKSGALGR